MKAAKMLATILAVMICLTSCDNSTHAQSQSGFFTPQAAARESSNAYPPITVIPKEMTKVVTPKKGVPEQLKEYTGYTVSYNPANHTPNYVAWTLTADRIDGYVSRKGEKFWHDNGVYGCAYTKDYTRSGYDRGHMCPAADNKYSWDAMDDSFSMANIAPQTPSLNRGAWGKLENKSRIWAQRDGGLVIICGPIYTRQDAKRLGYTGVRVPSTYFKVLYAPNQGRCIGFIYPNDKCPGNMRNYAVSVDKVEELTGFDFFSVVPDNIETKMESKCEFNAWN